MTILASATHKVLLKVSGTQTTLPDIGHAFVRDFFAAQMLSAGILPVVIQNADPGVSRLIIWFDPNGTTTVDAENAQGSFKISNDGTTWIADPTAAQWRTWLQFYIGGSSGLPGTLTFIAARNAGVNTPAAGGTITGSTAAQFFTATFPAVVDATRLYGICSSVGGSSGVAAYSVSAKNSTTITFTQVGEADNGSGGVGVGTVFNGSPDFIVFYRNP